ncbi:hypothetical protein EVAR_79501_1 [Eumeta japonica]|uniref:Uncharacterized protein n=1 Tax=Eumeta variegata TaxID=151549 RepID=A0A4C1UF38_EUMVA|nr:hypothetical protein EVAR_79501_1 [Eumeta japonica]
MASFYDIVRIMLLLLCFVYGTESRYRKTDYWLTTTTTLPSVEDRIGVMVTCPVGFERISDCIVVGFQRFVECQRYCGISTPAKVFCINAGSPRIVGLIAPLQAFHAMLNINVIEEFPGSLKLSTLLRPFHALLG